MAWMNQDGLYIKFGTELGHSLIDAGDVKTFLADGETVLTLEIDLTKLTESEQILSDAVYLPSNAQVTWIKSVAEVAAPTTGVAIDMGLIHTDRSTTTNVGPTVLLAAFERAGNYDTVGDTVTFTENTTYPASITGTGSLVGTILPTTDERYYLTASRTTSTAFTTGRLRIQIGYRPNALADNGN